jgi:hypothetical protein
VQSDRLQLPHRSVVHSGNGDHCSCIGSGGIQQIRCKNAYRMQVPGLAVSGPQDMHAMCIIKPHTLQCVLIKACNVTGM